MDVNCLGNWKCLSQGELGMLVASPLTSSIAEDHSIGGWTGQHGGAGILSQGPNALLKACSADLGDALAWFEHVEKPGPRDSNRMSLLS